jgi:hypothetical protein
MSRRILIKFGIGMVSLDAVAPLYVLTRCDQPYECGRNADFWIANKSNGIQFKALQICVLTDFLRC